VVELRMSLGLSRNGIRDFAASALALAVVAPSARAVWRAEAPWRHVLLAVLVVSAAVQTGLIAFHPNRQLAARVVSIAGIVGLAGVSLWLAATAVWLGGIWVGIGGGAALAVLAAGTPKALERRDWRVSGLILVCTTSALIASCAFDFPSLYTLGTLVEAVSLLSALTLGACLPIWSD